MLRLALPVVVARAGIIVLSAVDALMVGRFGAQDLAHLGLGTVPIGVLLAGSAGLLLGTLVLTAQGLGAGRPEECGAVWRRSVPYALLIGLLFALACQFGEALFRLTGQDPALAQGGGRVLAIYGYGMPAATLYLATSFFLEGVKRPLPGMIAMVAANLLNIPLNAWLIWGGAGIPALGAEGSAWATTLLRWATAVGIVAYLLGMRDRHRWGIRGSFAGWWRASGRQRYLGYAAGASQSLESAAFSALGLFAGYLGARALGAYTVGLNLIALPFMGALGLAVATGVRVGEAYGRGDRADLVMAGWTGLGVASLALAVVAAAFAIFPDAIAGAFTRDQALHAMLVPLVAFSASILIADGGQVVMASALRARQDVWIPTALHFFSYFGVMIPLSAVLAFGLDRGVRGLFEGILIASLVSVGVLSARFAMLARRDARARP